MRIPLVVACLGVLAMPSVVDAFCGFYVAGSNQPLLNDATQVVLMRKGTRTVLSMQNNYKGPPEAFAMIVPVPVVLHEQDVKTLTKDVFAHVEMMGAPRLVEYWEQDPCAPPVDYNGIPAPTAKGAAYALDDFEADDKLGVKIEAKFTVGEYQILILAAKDSTGLDTWLRQEKYNIPAGAEPLLRPYVEGGMKFFVAKVDPKKVVWDGDRAVLSPLRFHYDAEEFALPVRLGIANSSGTQDLIVNILAPGQRFEMANYPNVTIPTNIDVKPSVKNSFGAFYAALFDATVEKHQGAVVTEYAWQATTCDPCPGPALDASDFETLGADVLLGSRDKPERYDNADFVLTRLHARYGKDLENDLVFKQAGPIVGGREHAQSGSSAPGLTSAIEQGAAASTTNNFQGRYAIRYPWMGPIRCNNPVRGNWDGPPPEVQAQPGFQATGTKAALDLAAAPRGAIQLSNVIARDVPEIGLRAGASEPEPAPAAVQTPAGSAAAPPAAKKKTGCGCQATDPGGVLWLGGLAVAGLVRRRRRR
jgi:MYXO-CTERM domain-containing protein